MTSAGFQFSLRVFPVKDADPKQTLERYLEAIEKAFRLNRRVNPTTGAKGIPLKQLWKRFKGL